MSPKNERPPVVVTVKPTIIRVGPPEHSAIEDWHSRFTRPITIAATMTVVIGLASFATSFYSSGASFWLGVVGLLTTGAVLYRELCGAGLVPGRIVGLSLAIAPILLSCLFKLLPFPSIDPAYVAAVGCGLLVGWAAQTIGLISDAT